MPVAPHRVAFVALALIAALGVGASAGCDDAPPGPPPIDPLVSQAEIDSGELVEVVACRHSHEHELNHVKTLANAAAAEQFNRCVLTPGANCADLFPEGALFVKVEYELEGCKPEDLKGYTVNKKLAAGSYADGHDWQWQRLTKRLEVTEDGAPLVCLLCHIEHCSAPNGHDLRCLPD